jgi:uncharacterized membrane protein
MTDAHSRIRSITENGLIAALYFILTAFIPSISFQMFNFRFGEVLVLLCFWRPDFGIGLSVGCLLANFYGAATGQTAFIDMALGTLGTVLSVICVAFLSPRFIVSVIYPPIFNGVLVGLMLYYFYDFGSIALYVEMGWVALGELVVILGGYILWMLAKRAPWFFAFLKPTRHQDVSW